MERHYDAVARNARDVFQGDDAKAMRARSSGAAAPLKRFHNVIKRHLISVACPQPGCTVLDMACGRGGDVHKYINVGAQHVVGIDISSEEITEAIRRAHNAVSGERSPPTFEFFVSDLRDSTTPLSTTTRTFDVVSCMFALHYFAETPETLRALLRVAFASLKPGGMFIGTASSGPAIERLLGGAREYLSPALRIERVPPNKIMFTLRDTVTDTVDGGGVVGSDEYFLDEDVLDSVAHDIGFSKVDIGYLEGCIDSTTRRFTPDFGPRAVVGLDVASCLFFAFAFRKPL
jgi:ubiquinone/menaquinone biosynthesis C-methylase UbiE